MLRTQRSLCRLQVRFNSHTALQLGLRSRRPPDSAEEPSGPHHSEEEDVSDHEWDMRTARAIYTLQQTLPEFFERGLVSCHSEESRSVIPLVGLGLAKKQKDDDDDETIYSPRVRLTYTPPIQLSAPFPKTFHIEGLPLYLASSVFIRHTMKTFYSHLHVGLTKCVVDTPTGKRDKREKSVTISLSVVGASRVSGTQSQWDVTSTYGFSPQSGLILTHAVNEIHPAPHSTAYEGLKGLLGFFNHPSPGLADTNARAVRSDKTS